MYKLVTTTQFKKDLKKIKNNSRDFESAVLILKILELKGVHGVPKNMKPHKLSGAYKDNWECHIKPDLLIIWFQIEEDYTIKLVRIGSHSELFN